MPYSSKVGSRTIPRGEGPKIVVQAETGEKPVVSPKEPLYTVRMDQIRSKVDINSVKYDNLTDVWKKQRQKSVPPLVQNWARRTSIKVRKRRPDFGAGVVIDGITHAD